MKKYETYRIAASEIPIPTSDIQPNKLAKEVFAGEVIKRVIVKRYMDGAILVDIEMERPKP